MRPNQIAPDEFQGFLQGASGLARAADEKIPEHRERKLVDGLGRLALLQEYMARELGLECWNLEFCLQGLACL